MISLHPKITTGEEDVKALNLKVLLSLQHNMTSLQERTTKINYL